MSNPAAGAEPTQTKEKKLSTHDKEESKGGLGELIQFLRDTWIEFRKISWPPRQQVMRDTMSVLFLITLITLAVLAFDWIVAKAVFNPLDSWARHMGGGIPNQSAPMQMPMPMPMPAPSPQGATPSPEQPGATPAPSSSTPAPAGAPTSSAPAPTGEPGGTTAGTPASLTPTAGQPQAPAPGATSKPKND